MLINGFLAKKPRIRYKNIISDTQWIRQKNILKRYSGDQAHLLFSGCSHDRLDTVKKVQDTRHSEPIVNHGALLLVLHQTGIFQVCKIYPFKW